MTEVFGSDSNVVQEWCLITWLARWFVPLRHLRSHLSVSANHGRTSSSQINKPLPMEPTGKSNSCPNQSRGKWKYIVSWGKPKETLPLPKTMLCRSQAEVGTVNYLSFDGMWLWGEELNKETNSFQLTATWRVRAERQQQIFIRRSSITNRVTTANNTGPLNWDRRLFHVLNLYKHRCDLK